MYMQWTTQGYRWNEHLKTIDVMNNSGLCVQALKCGRSECFLIRNVKSKSLKGDLIDENEYLKDDAMNNLGLWM